MKFRTFICGLAVALIANISVGQEIPDAIDADSDGAVSVKEFATYAGSRLGEGQISIDDFAKQVDADGDGVISQAEFVGRREILASMMSKPQSGADEDSAEKDSADEGPLEVGDAATDFDLQSIDSKVQLSTLTAQGKSVVVVFSRANW